MTRYTPLWIQPGIYPANQDRQVLSAIWPGPGTTGLLVYVSSGLTLNVAPGVAAIPTPNATGTTLGVSDGTEIVTLAAAPASNSRIDLVCVQSRGNDLDGGSNNDLIFTPVTGTPAASPVAPATPAGMVALAQATVTSAGTVTLTDIRPWALNPLLISGTAVGQSASFDIYSSQVSGDTYPRFQITADGTTSWGPGNAALDVTMRRQPEYGSLGGSGVLNVPGSFQVGNNFELLIGNHRQITAVGTVAFTRFNDDAGQLFAIDQTGSFWWSGQDPATWYAWGGNGDVSLEHRPAQYGQNGLILTGYYVGLVPLTIQAYQSGQTADLLDIKNSSGTTLFGFGATGTFTNTQGAPTNIAVASLTTGDSNNRFQQTVGGVLQWGPGNAAWDVQLNRSPTVAGVLQIQGPGGSRAQLGISGAMSVTEQLASGIPFQLTGAASQTGNLFMMNYNTGTALAWFDANGMLHLSVPNTSTAPAITIKAASGQTADLQQFLSNASATLSGYDANGRPYVGSPASWGGGTGPMLFVGNDTADPSTNPTGGVILFSSAGVLKARDPSGVVTQIAPPSITMRFQTVTANGTFVVPAGVTSMRIIAVGGGGGGGGGGSSQVTTPVAQGAAGGGGAGAVADMTIAVTPGQTLTHTIGAGGNGGTGGAAGSGATGNPGVAPASGGTATTVTGTGVSVTAYGGGFGNFSGASTTTGGGGGFPGVSSLYTSATVVGAIGCGGYSVNTLLRSSPQWPQGPAGGQAGKFASTTLGGTGGVAGVWGVQYAAVSGVGGDMASTTGGNGATAAANSGCGGGGGGGGAAGGAGGNGGAGGSGYVTYIWTA